MRCTGTVIEDRGETALVRIDAHTCGDCHACGFGAVREDKSMDVTALNSVGAEKDDPVRMEVSGKKIMSASAILYLIPFTGFMAGFLIGYYPVWFIFETGNSTRTLIAVILAFVLLVPSYYLVHVLGKRSKFEFTISGILDEEDLEAQPAGVPDEKPVS